LAIGLFVFTFYASSPTVPRTIAILLALLGVALVAGYTVRMHGALDNTYLIFTSDQGFMQGQHRLHQGKFVPYDPSTQVPLLIRGPGIPAGSQPRALAWNGDITATVHSDEQNSCSSAGCLSIRIGRG
jgi:hypothetical protein